MLKSWNNDWKNNDDDFFGFKPKFQKKETILDSISNGTPVTKIIIPVFQITYKEESGFGVYTCIDVHSSQGDIENKYSIKGTFVFPLILGQTYEVTGTVCSYKTEYVEEKQINATSTKNIRPVNKRGIISYLQTLKGLKSKADDIYNKFGDKCVDILINDPMRVAKEIKGIGKRSVLSWSEQLEKMKDSQQTMATLLGYGINPKQSKALYDKYGDNIINKIEGNPYFLALEVRGYGFKNCDKIARNMGYNPKSKFRIHEGIVHVLTEATMDGHCFLPKDVLVNEAIELLRYRLTAQEMTKFLVEKINEKEFEYYIGMQKFMINYAELRKQFDLYNREQNPRKKEFLRYTVVDFEEADIVLQFEELRQQERIIIDITKSKKDESEKNNSEENEKDTSEDVKIYLTYLYYDECRVAKRVIEIAQYKLFKTKLNFEGELDRYLKVRNICLEEKQRLAVCEFGKTIGGFNVLDGSAGCGKTFTLKIILEMLRMQFLALGRKEFRVKVYAPTGKASKVAARATSLPCATVHRGLGYNPQFGYEYNSENPLEADVVVIDESSMLDITLTKHLLNAIAFGTKVIFLGDIKQLPSVGPGNVLKDLIESEVVKIVTLDVVKRQGLLSGITRNANKIINGEMIYSCEDTQDAYVWYRDSPVAVQKGIIDSIKRIQETKNFDLEDIQVLCPQRTSLVGTYMMNYLIQQEFNPDNNEIVVQKMKFEIKPASDKPKQTIILNFKKGDKVIHIKNNYNMEWYDKGNYADYVRDKEKFGITNGECGVIEEIKRFKEKEDDKDEKTRIIVRYEDKYVFYDDAFDELEHAYALTIHKSQGSQWKAVITPIMKQNFLMLDNNLFYTAYTRAELFSVVIGQKDAIAYAITNHKIRDRYTGLKERIVSLYDAA